MSKNYYQILALDRNCSREDVCIAYRKLSLSWHPSKNPQNILDSIHVFHELAEAYEVLSNPQLRTCFDKFGEFGLKKGIQVSNEEFEGGYSYAGNAYEIFEKFFGTQDPFSEDYKEDIEKVYSRVLSAVEVKLAELPEDLVVTLQCTLSELYNGCSKTVTYKRKVLLHDSKTLAEEEISKLVEVKQGYNSKTKLVFEGEGHESPYHPTSNLVVGITELPDEQFRREGNNLVFRAELVLLDAVFSEPVKVTTLDKRVLTVSLDEVIGPNHKVVLEGEGMPSEGGRGNLVVEFNIKFPKYVPQKDLLKSILI